jgi:hypothetical protein
MERVMNYRNGYAKIELDVEIILSSPRYLFDSLLAGILFELYRDGPKAVADVPLQATDGCFHASQAFMEYPGSTRMHTVFANASAEVVRDTSHVSTVLAKSALLNGPAKARRIPRIDASTGDYKIKQSTYITYQTPRLWFFFRGDLERVEQILNRVQFVGTLRTRGWGQVRETLVGEVDSTDPLFGLVAKGQVLRPIPLRLRHHLPDDIDYREKTETWKPPYHWTEFAEPCMIPAEDRPRTTAEIRQLVL